MLMYSSWSYMLQARVASQLVWRSHVRPGDIAVLSLYPAQAHLIHAALRDKNIQDISVLPVSNSRGKPVIKDGDIEQKSSLFVE